MNQNQSKLRNLTVSALLAAMIFIGTNFLKVPLPIGQEYIHLGDGFVFIVAMIVPLPYAMAAAAVGASLADILGGYAVWAPWTAVIKALLALTVSLFCRKGRASVLKIAYAMTVATLINTLGYYLAGAVIYQNFFTGLPAVPLTVLQSLGGAAVYLILYKFVKKIVDQY